jgi:hypothetical protein
MNPLRPFLPLMMTALMLWVTACREVYEPEIDTRQGVVVVEGVITNLNEPASVFLWIARPYNSTRPDSAVRGARVMIREDSLGYYELHEKGSGEYITLLSEFQPRAGHSYTLLVITPDGDTCLSTAQQLLSPARIDSLYGIITAQEYIYKDVYGKIVGKMEDGSQTLVDFSGMADPGVQYRFSTKVLTGFTNIDHSTMPFPSIVYNWKKSSPGESVTLSGTGTAVNTSHVVRFPAGFFLFNEYLYGLDSKEHIENWFLQLRQYTLNAETFSYYRDVERQLSNSGAIFDPIASQIRGNIRCVNHPEKLVLGHFEASGCTKKTCYIKPHPYYRTVEYLPSVDLDSIPDSGRSVQTAPFFWRF